MTSSIFSFPNIQIAISTKKDGTMKHKKKFVLKNVQTFLSKHAITDNLITMNQVHGNKVVRNAPVGSTVDAADAVISVTPNSSIGVVTADCLPVLLYDVKTHAIAAAHAGYRGIFSEILPHVIAALEKSGSKRKNIFVGIGPAIGTCCYRVDLARASDFSAKFGSKYVVRKGDGEYLDLKNIAYDQLVQAGVVTDHINIIPICTSCQNETYFSYRKDTDDTFGEFISVIARKN